MRNDGASSEGQTVRQKELHRRGMVLSTVGGAMMVAQFVLLFFIGRDYVPLLRYLGFVLWAAGCVLAWLPIFYFRRKASVPKGKSYVNTTVLVTTGIYSVVRHPQYLSFFLLAFGLALIGQHWVFFLLGAIGSVIYGLGLIGEDEANIEKFGDDYRRYKEQVPGYNILLGFIRRLARGRSR
jgi:protein-S-isoprenylcysteine O-methyltransferase Ste14